MGKTKKIVIGDVAVEKEQREKKDQKREAKKAQQTHQKLEQVPAEASSEESAALAPKKEEKKTTKIVKKAHGSKYKLARAKTSKDKKYAIVEAVGLLKDMVYTSFDSSVELTINVLETGLKGEITLPHGTGKKVVVAVFGPEVEAKIKENKLDFDVLLATPDDMKSLVKFARVLGPKGLMPSPKKGTVTTDLEAATKKFTSGNVQYKTEPKFPIMHQVVGKTSFTEKQLEQNILAFLKAVAKKNIVSVFIKSTMSPSMSLHVNELE